MDDDWAAGRSPRTQATPIWRFLKSWGHPHPFWIMSFHGIDHAAIEVPPPLKQENSICTSIVMIIIEDPILMVH